MRRLIRVHLGGESTFVVESHDGVVTYCSRGYSARVRDCPDPSGLVGKSELDAARALRSEGAGFVDLLNDRREVRVRRGYRPAQTQRSGALRYVGGQHDPPQRKRPAGPAQPVKRNAVAESLKDWKPVSDVDTSDVPF